MTLPLESSLRPTSVSDSGIFVQGARTHNLRNLSIAIPRDRFVVITGLSGSGKSSLAFDTLHAEGQRRYLETVAIGARGFLDQLERPDVESITGLPPTLSVSQRAGSIRPRSTLATTTEIADRLRLLYARAGIAHSPHGGSRVERQTVDQIVQSVSSAGDRAKAMILAPIVRGRKGEHKSDLDLIVKEGFVRARIDGKIVDSADPPTLDRHRSHDIEAVVDRVIIKEGIAPRLRESIELALKLGDGLCIVTFATDDDWVDRLYSEHFVCPETGESFPPLEPRSFSFNNPHGACPTCHGLGAVADEADEARRSMNAASRGNRRRDKPPAATIVCPDCGGERLNPFSRLVTLAGVRLPEFLAQTAGQALAWFEAFAGRLERDDPALDLTSTGRLAAAKIIPELVERLRYLDRVGLDYLTLDRPTKTLSGGEFQRARLASAIGSGLVGVCYILDEPTIGLHPRDIRRLIDTLIDLREAGNSVLVVEHDLAVIAAADYLIELGPGAGSEGGRVVAAGAPAELARRQDTATGPFLARGQASGLLERPVRPVDDETPRLALVGISKYNLDNINVQIPLGRFVVVSGVSGSGKSTLVMDVATPLVREALTQRGAGPISIPGLDPETDLPRRLVSVDQSPLGRTGRSTPATYCGLWDNIRRLFAATKQARQLGFKSSRFSVLSREGRCDECEGRGGIKLAMTFLPDLTVTCPRCEGKRFNPQTLAVRYQGHSVADVLNLRVDEALVLFAGLSKIEQRLQVLSEVGLGYLTLGQSALSLSGGEAQRIRLASELSLPGQLGVEPTLFVLDEPTTGLHPQDTSRLISLLQRLVDDGHSVIAIEHDADFIAAADWVIDLGPEGGAAGGRIIATGTPADIAKMANSHTGRALASVGQAF